MARYQFFRAALAVTAIAFVGIGAQAAGLVSGGQIQDKELEAQRALQKQVEQQVEAAVAKYKKGSKDEGLAMLAKIETGGEFYCELVKCQGKIRMFLPDHKLLSGLVDQMIKEGGKVNAHALVVLPQLYRDDMGEKHRTLVLRACQQGIKLDPLNGLIYANACDSYLNMGDKEKALEVVNKGLEIVEAENNPRKNRGLEMLLNDLKKKAS